MEKTRILKPLNIILTVVAILVIIEGLLYLDLRENYTSLYSSNQELQERNDQLETSYEELKSTLQDLNSSYIELLSYYFGEYGDVSVEQAKTLIEDKTELVIVDVRTIAEYEESHIEGALNICVGCYPEDILNHLNPEDEILLYCQSGLRSAVALRILFENGYPTVYNMQGGISAWINAGFPVVEK